jgi:DNA-directed RNA polymerase subunit RPC12/RpoP
MRPMQHLLTYCCVQLITPFACFFPVVALVEGVEAAGLPRSAGFLVYVSLGILAMAAPRAAFGAWRARCGTCGAPMDWKLSGAEYHCLRCGATVRPLDQEVAWRKRPKS